MLHALHHRRTWTFDCCVWSCGILLSNKSVKRKRSSGVQWFFQLVENQCTLFLLRHGHVPLKLLEFCFGIAYTLIILFDIIAVFLIGYNCDSLTSDWLTVSTSATVFFWSFSYGFTWLWLFIVYSRPRI